MKVYKEKTFAEIYKNVLSDVLFNPEYESKPRDKKIKEITNVSFVIENPYYCLYSNKRRSSQLKYIAAELVWYFTGRNDTDFISKFAKFWQYIDNGDGTVNSAYGNLIFNEKNEYHITQYEWAINSLKKDKDSRQAILHFNKPKHQWSDNKDFVCTLNSIFQIRNNRLNFTVNMRSNDLILGTPTDIAFFSLLQQQALKHLQLYYPDLKMGTYTHNVNSLHIYEKHFGLVNEMLGKSFIAKKYPEISNNIIDERGKPLPLFKKIESGVINNKTITNLKDPLYNWIIKNIFEHEN